MTAAPTARMAVTTAEEMAGEAMAVAAGQIETGAIQSRVFALFGGPSAPGSLKQLK